MECYICHKPFTSKRKPTCASCAQAALYSSRLDQVTALLSRENAHTHAEAVLRPGNDGILAALPVDADFDAIERSVKTHCIERDSIATQAAEARVQDITTKAAQLRKEIESHRAFITKRKEEQARRREDLRVTRADMKNKHDQAVEPVKAAIKKANGRLKKVHDRTVEARLYICQVVTSLSGLRKTKSKDSPSLFWLGGLPVPDLHDLNGTTSRLKFPSVDGNAVEPHEIINASLSNVCHLLGVVCHYLSIRLPAEILLPGPDFSTAAIVPLDSSYRIDIHEPGASSSRLPRSGFSRPRSLHLSRPFPTLEKENPKAAGYFREAVVLLAYDIAWLCRSQGLDVGSSFNDIADVGRNLHSLLPRPDGRKRPQYNRNLTNDTNQEQSRDLFSHSVLPRFGLFSHGTSHHNLASSEGTSLFGPSSNWDVSIPKLFDQLKVYLRKESQRAEWDFIEQAEWDEELEEERPVLIGGTRKMDAKGAAMSVMTVKPSDDEAVPRLAAKGGWMKLRGRPGEG